jgi:alkylation response protein AidB-like acyl-CoA dehydrogenase
VNLLPDAAQQEVMDAAAAFLRKEFPAERARALAAASASGTGVDGVPVLDRTRWARMGALGWFALGVPAVLGGAGCGVVEETLLFRELGRSLAPGPFVAQVLAAHVAAGVGGSGPIFASIAAGEVVVGLAEPHGEEGGWRVVDGAGADFLLAVSPEGVRLVEAPAGAGSSGVSLDPLTALGFVDLADAAVVAGFASASVVNGAGRLVDNGRVLVAAMLVGICEATRDESARYARDRSQFGRPIGSFQAVKHRCADMAVRAEAAGSLTFLAALSLREGAVGAPELVAQAKALASEYALASAADNIQNHGGMGFTADCDAHLYLKRTNILATMLGSPASIWPETVR